MRSPRDPGVRRDYGHGGAVRVVVIRLEEVARVDGRRDAAAQRALVRAPQGIAVRGVDEDRLDEHREVLVPRRVAIRLAHDPRDGARDAADEERRHVRLLPDLEAVEEDDGDLRVELHAATLRVPATVRSW